MDSGSIFKLKKKGFSIKKSFLPMTKTWTDEIGHRKHGCKNVLGKDHIESEKWSGMF